MSIFKLLVGAPFLRVRVLCALVSMGVSLASYAYVDNFIHECNSIKTPDGESACAPLKVEYPRGLTIGFCKMIVRDVTKKRPRCVSDHLQKNCEYRDEYTEEEFDDDAINLKYLKSGEDVVIQKIPSRIMEGDSVCWQKNRQQKKGRQHGEEEPKGTEMQELAPAPAAAP